MKRCKKCTFCGRGCGAKKHEERPKNKVVIRKLTPYEKRIICQLMNDDNFWKK